MLKKLDLDKKEFTQLIVHAKIKTENMLHMNNLLELKNELTMQLVSMQNFLRKQCEEIMCWENHF